MGKNFPSRCAICRAGVVGRRLRERRLRAVLPLVGRAGQEGRAEEGRGAGADAAAAAAERGRRPRQGVGQRQEQALPWSVSVRRKVLPLNLCVYTQSVL